MPARIELIDRLEALFESARNPTRAREASAYMRNQFPFYGISSPNLRLIAREAVSDESASSEAAVRTVVLGCWKRPEREWQYFACGYLRSSLRTLSGDFLPTAERLITMKSWWDTVDTLAAHTVGPLVRGDSGLVARMDSWIDSDDIWLARAAILHQLGYRSETNADRLFDYCLRRADESEFFLRKAIGWALREYSKTDPRAVQEFVHEHDDRLSSLSKREALKRI